MKRQNLTSVKLNILLITLFCSLASIKAQDKIILQGGDTIEVKISKITEKSISYHLSNYADGPLYEVSHSRVSRIIYPHGEEIAFEDGFGPGTQIFDNHKNSIEVIVSEFVAGRASMAYSRILGKRLELRLQGAYSFDDNFDLENFAGFQFLYHPLSFRKVDYYTGISSRVGNMTEYYYPYYENYNSYISMSTPSLAMTVELVNGFKVNLNQRFAINFGFTAGAFASNRGRSGAIFSGFVGTAFRF